jgi:hypothetical protein
MQHQAIISYVTAYLHRILFADIEVQQAERHALMTEYLRPISEGQSEEEILHSPALFAKPADKLAPRDLVFGMHVPSLVPGLAFRGTPVSVRNSADDATTLPARLRNAAVVRTSSELVVRNATAILVCTVFL